MHASRAQECTPAAHKNARKQGNPLEVLRQGVQHVELLHRAGAPGADGNVQRLCQQLLAARVLLQAVQHAGCGWSKQGEEGWQRRASWGESGCGKGVGGSSPHVCRRRHHAASRLHSQTVRTFGGGAAPVKGAHTHTVGKAGMRGAARLQLLSRSLPPRGPPPPPPPPLSPPHPTPPTRVHQIAHGIVLRRLHRGHLLLRVVLAAGAGAGAARRLALGVLEAGGGLCLGGRLLLQTKGTLPSMPCKGPCRELAGSTWQLRSAALPPPLEPNLSPPSLPPSLTSTSALPLAAAPSAPPSAASFSASASSSDALWISMLAAWPCSIKQAWGVGSSVPLWIGSEGPDAASASRNQRWLPLSQLPQQRGCRTPWDSAMPAQHCHQLRDPPPPPRLISQGLHRRTSRPVLPRKAEYSYLTFSTMPCRGPCCARASSSASL